MKHIFVFVDFTNTSVLAFNQALAIATMKEAKISLCHIAKELNKKSRADFENNLEPFKVKAQEHGVTLEPIILGGDLFKTAKEVVLELRPDLIVAGTHGAEGIHLSLFGSAIHKLVREVSAPTLVIGKMCEPMKSGFKKVLLPASVHDYNMADVERTCDLLADQAEVILYAVVHTDRPLDQKILENLEKAKAFLDERQISWNYVEEKAKPHQTGFAGQTLDYMRKNEIEMITISAEVSNKFKLFGKLDKEAILLNEDGIMVLCSKYD